MEFPFGTWGILKRFLPCKKDFTFKRTTMSCCLWVLLGSLNQNALSLSSAPCHLNWSPLDCSWPLYCPSICIDTVSYNNRKSRTGSSCRPVHPVSPALSQRQFVGGGHTTVTVTVLGNINLVPLFIGTWIFLLSPRVQLGTKTGLLMG